MAVWDTDRPPIMGQREAIHPTIVSDAEANRARTLLAETNDTKKLMLASNDPKIRGVADVLSELGAKPLHYVRVYHLLKKI